MSEQKCAICGKPFEVYRNRKYCSEECKSKAKRELQKKAVKERGGRNIGDIMTCPTCGKNFLYSSGRKRYCCVECKNKAQQMRIGEAATPRPRKKRARTMAEIARAAREEHLSYGEYVLKYGI